MQPMEQDHTIDLETKTRLAPKEIVFDQLSEIRARVLNLRKTIEDLCREETDHDRAIHTSPK